MRTGVVSSQELAASGRRLNGGFFLTEDERAYRKLLEWCGRAEALLALAQRDGIYTGGIFKKIPAASQRYGTPYVSARDIMKSDVRVNGYLSHRHGEFLDTLKLREGMILLTCSGMNLGESIWVRSDMTHLAGSGDLIRILVDEERVAPGYVFAFMSSRYGHVSVRRLIFGGNIRHISPKEVSQILVPRLRSDVEASADRLVREASALRVQSRESLDLASGLLARELRIGEGEEPERADDYGYAVSSSVLANSARLEAHFYNRRAMEVDRWARLHPNGYWNLNEVANVFDVPPFKHIYVESDRGIPFFTSGELFDLNRSPEKYLSKTQTRGLHKYVIEEGWVLLARSGQLGGILGRPLYAASDLHQVCVSDHVIRIVATGDVPPGYLYAYLNTDQVGYVSLTRTMAGASVPALWPVQLAQVPIVKTSPAFMNEIHERVVNAFEMRVEASSKDTLAKQLVEDAIEEGGRWHP